MKPSYEVGVVEVDKSLLRTITRLKAETLADRESNTSHLVTTPNPCILEPAGKNEDLDVAADLNHNRIEAPSLDK